MTDTNTDDPAASGGEYVEHRIGRKVRYDECWKCGCRVENIEHHDQFHRMIETWILRMPVSGMKDESIDRDVSSVDPTPRRDGVPDDGLTPSFDNLFTRIQCEEKAYQDGWREAMDYVREFATPDEPAHGAGDVLCFCRAFELRAGHGIYREPNIHRREGCGHPDVIKAVVESSHDHKDQFGHAADIDGVSRFDPACEVCQDLDRAKAKRAAPDVSSDAGVYVPCREGKHVQCPQGHIDGYDDCRCPCHEGYDRGHQAGFAWGRSEHDESCGGVGADAEKITLLCRGGRHGICHSEAAYGCECPCHAHQGDDVGASRDVVATWAELPHGGPWEVLENLLGLMANIDWTDGDHMEHDGPLLESVIRAALEHRPDGPSSVVDAIEVAWGIIANAYGGDWSVASHEWRDAAERWRDEHYGDALAVANAAAPSAGADKFFDRPSLCWDRCYHPLRYGQFRYCSRPIDHEGTHTDGEAMWKAGHDDWQHETVRPASTGATGYAHPLALVLREVSRWSVPVRTTNGAVPSTTTPTVLRSGPGGFKTVRSLVRNVDIGHAALTPKATRQQLIEIAALAVAAVESFDRRSGGKS